MELHSTTFSSFSPLSFYFDHPISARFARSKTINSSTTWADDLPMNPKRERSEKEKDKRIPRKRILHLSWPLAVSWILRPRDVTVKVAKSTRSTRVKIDILLKTTRRTNGNNPQTTSNTMMMVGRIRPSISEYQKLAAHTSRQYHLYHHWNWCPAGMGG